MEGEEKLLTAGVPAASPNRCSAKQVA